MKRLIAVLSGLLVLPAFAEVAPVFYEDVIEYADETYDAYDDVDAQQIQEEEESKSAPAPTANNRISPRATTGRAASRAVASNATTTPTRGTSARTNTATRTTSSVQTRTATPSRAVATRTSRAATSNSNVAASPRVSTRRTDTTPTNASTARASIVQSDTVNTPLYTGRVGVRTSSTVASRMPTIRASASTTAVETEAVSTTSMDELAQITDFCKAQYTSCMDNFCNVLDDNQGRCSCSTNLKNYSKTEEALKQATEDLQDVAQKIQYIGLTGDEIETLFTQTEAELKMQSTNDNTQLKNDLDRIKNMIVDVKAGTATATDTGISLDLTGLLDFSISSTGFDLSSLFGNTTNTSSISNQRGEQLYKTATARCKASVLNSCQAQGVDISIITNAYDLEIDKQCIAYERSLNDANDQMSSTVRNAKSVLQKARLMVAQQKNAYDLRGCINALDTCMQDDFVCGSDYENCLDPSGKYIVNGEVVIGSLPGVSGGELDLLEGKKGTGLYSTWDYSTNSNAWGKTGTLSAYIEAYVQTTFPTIDMDKMANYLQQKIGKIKDGKASGMCASVLNKCQDYTFTANNNKEYNPANQVVKSYLERTLIQIKSAQDKVLADYAESCISDVATCLSQNNYNTYNNTSNEPSDVAVRACMAVINTCKSVNERSGEVASVAEWLKEALYSTYDADRVSCTNTGGTWTQTGKEQGKCECKQAGYTLVGNKCTKTSN